MTQGLDGVRRTAQARKQERFTALLHHVTIDSLRTGYYALKRRAAPGVDGAREETSGAFDVCAQAAQTSNPGAIRNNRLMLKQERRIYQR